MNTLFEVLALVWSVLCLILFFKIWGMTNDVKEIRDFLIDCKKPETIRKPEDGVVKREDTFEYTPEQFGKFHSGDLVCTASYSGVLEIVDCYEDSTYNCKDTSTNELIGVFKESELKAK
ncbi:MAG: hypothetical protein K5893_00915 [Prevotella sp.]|nr:hypothetical protein [Prevotella sp.]